MRRLSPYVCKAAATQTVASVRKLSSPPKVPSAAAPKPVEEHAQEQQVQRLTEDAFPTTSEPSEPMPTFFMKGRRGWEAPQYYSTLSSAGHPDDLAVLLDGGRTDPEWMRLKFLCFLCLSSTVGTWMYQFYFYEQAKWFKDEPWSPFQY